MMFFVYSYLIVGVVFTLFAFGVYRELWEKKSEKEKKETLKERGLIGGVIVVTQFVILPIAWLPFGIYYAGRMFVEETEGD